MGTQSFYTERMEDSFAAYLTSDTFGVYGDGIHDDTKGIQEAINFVKDTYGFGVVFMPEGIYRVTDTIYIPRAIRLIGYGKNRPQIRLGAYSPGYDQEYVWDKGNAKYVIWFTHKVPVSGEDESVIDANPGTFYSALSNIDIRIEEGNPSAIALRTHYAQHGFIAHCNIEVGSGKAGIFDVGNEIEDVHIYGGRYGIITTKCSPGWPFVMVDTSFTGQSLAAIKTREGGLTIIRTHVKNTPRFVTVDDGYMEKLYVEDSILENISEAALVVACENNTLSQYNLRNTFCLNTPIFAKYRESGRVIEGESTPYHIKSFVHGVQIDDLGAREEVKTTFDRVCLSAEDIQPFATNIPVFPPMDTWVNLRDLGAKGDGKSDDTEILKNAVEQYETIYIPQGWYVVTETITLKQTTKLIGMSPIGTQLILPDNTESFGGLGAPKAVLETPIGGTNIVYGIGIDAGGRNARAVGCKWMSGEASYMNDVKFMGGHGIMEWGNGGFINPYNANRTGDYHPDRSWDSQYWSLWITNGGGGVFKDIWSASPYANAGLYISDTSTKGCIYAISLEHHVRAEAKLKNVSNWKIFGLQTEEELAEGPKAQPLELMNCRNLLFANLYTFRVVMVNTPFDYCIRISDCKNVEFLNLHNYSQMKYTINSFLLDVNTNIEVRPWQIGRLYVSGATPAEVPLDTYAVERICGDFQFIDGGCCDGQGNFYFVDGELKRIYQINGKTQSLKMIMDAPYKPYALCCDTEGRVIVIAEYDTPPGATKGGERIQHEKIPFEGIGSSFFMYYPPNKKLCAYTFDPENPERTFTALERVKRANIKRPEKVLYPGNRWRDFHDYETGILKTQDECFMAQDGKTIIPIHHDLMRSAYLAEVTPGEAFYGVDEYYKRTYRCMTDADGYIKSLSLLAERGEFCSIPGPEGSIYICDGQIQIYDAAGVYIRQIHVPERPATIAFGGENKDTLYIAARKSVYRLNL